MSWQKLGRLPVPGEERGANKSLQPERELGRGGKRGPSSRERSFGQGLNAQVIGLGVTCHWNIQNKMFKSVDRQNICVLLNVLCPAKPVPEVLQQVSSYLFPITFSLFIIIFEEIT